MNKSYWIYGTHAAEAALKNPRRKCKRLCILKAAENQLSYPEKSINAEVVEPHFFKKLFGEQAVHQGVALEVEQFPSVNLSDFLQSIKNDPTSLIAFLDQVTDPHNIGAILRSAAAFGVKALVVPEHASASLTSPVLAKSASGALECMPLIVVTNLVKSLEILKKNDFWIIGLAERGTHTLAQENLNGRYGLVLGSEGKGLRRLTLETCDILVKLPTFESFTTLNVSNAAAVAFYEFYRQNN